MGSQQPPSLAPQPQLVCPCAARRAASPYFSFTTDLMSTAVSLAMIDLQVLGLESWVLGLGVSEPRQHIRLDEYLSP